MKAAQVHRVGGGEVELTYNLGLFLEALPAQRDKMEDRKFAVSALSVPAPARPERSLSKDL